MRWTVRSVDPNAIALIQSVAKDSGQTMGALLTEAIRVWYDHRPEPTPDPEIIELQKQFWHFNRLLEELFTMLGRNRR